jgi:hypothetical protein
MEFLNQKEFNGAIIKEQYRFCNTLYIITYLDGKYKLIQIGEDYPKGKKLGENRSAGELHSRIPNY